MANLDMNNEKLSRCILHNELYFHQWVNLTKSQQKYVDKQIQLHPSNDPLIYEQNVAYFLEIETEKNKQLRYKQQQMIVNSNRNDSDNSGELNQAIGGTNKESIRSLRENFLLKFQQQLN